MYVSILKLGEGGRSSAPDCCRCGRSPDHKLTIESMVWGFCEEHLLDALLDAVNFATETAA